MNDIIKIMIQQFCINTNRLIAMIGAKNLAYDNKTNSFNFMFKMCKKSNMCKLSYNKGLDLYNMEFLKYNNRTCEVKEIKKYNGLYSDQLKSIFEDFTGLYISL